MSENASQIVGAAQSEDISALSMTAKPVYSLLELNQLTLRHNVRDASEYNLPPLIESFRRNGFRPSSPLVVHVSDDGAYEVLAGNRRTNALKSLTAEELPKVLAATDGKVPCNVYTKLTPTQVEILRCDHGSDEDREPLSKYGLFVAVSRLLLAGLNQTAIAVRLGLYITKDNIKKPNRSLVQVYAAAAALPERVRTMLKAYWLRGEGLIRQSDVMPLSKVWNEEWVQFGINGQEGPQFQAKVDEILARSGTAPVQTTKTLTAKAAEDRAKIMTSPVTRQLLVAATAADANKLVELDKQLVARDRMFRQIDWLMRNKTSQISKLLEMAEKAIVEEDAAEAKRREAAAEAARQQATPVVTAPPTLPT